MSIIYSNLEIADTYEAYNGDIIFFSDNLLIPFINLRLMPENPINGTKSYVDYAYILYENVTDLVLNDKIFFANSKKKEKDGIVEYITLTSFNAEAKITFEKGKIFLLDNTNIRSEHFIPYKTPLLSQNIDSEKASDFFSNKHLPEALKYKIGINYYIINGNL